MIHPQGEALLRAHGEREFSTPAFNEIAPGVYHAYAMGHSNATVIVANTGCILVDTLDAKPRGERLRDTIAEVIGKPVHTIIYTHIHPDHRGGASAFADSAKEIIAFRPHTTPPPGNARILPVLNKRGALQFGFGLDDEDAINQGLGPRAGRAYGEVAAPLKPTTLYNPSDDIIRRNIDGVELELHFAPGETNDQCFVWLPKQRILCSGDNYYACFPNLYALRGTPYREVSDWVAALDKLIAMDADVLLPGHTRALHGRDTIREVLSNYRDAIKFVYDETLACLAKDMTIDEAVEAVQLPDHLRELPYLGEYYGTVAWSVRSIYTGHVGWFDGNPTSLEPLPLAERAHHIIDLAGGEDALRKRIRTALSENDFQWAAELADHLLALNKGDNDARLLKAQALEGLAPLETSANGRHYYQMWARILRGDIDGSRWDQSGKLFPD